MSRYSEAQKIVKKVNELKCQYKVLCGEIERIDETLRRIWKYSPEIDYCLVRFYEYGSLFQELAERKVKEYIEYNIEMFINEIEKELINKKEKLNNKISNLKKEYLELTDKELKKEE